MAKFGFVHRFHDLKYFDVGVFLNRSCPINNLVLSGIGVIDLGFAPLVGSNWCVSARGESH